MAKRGYESNKTGGKVDELLDKIDNLNVPEWALQKNKPNYTAQEVHALPENTPIPTVPQNVSAFNNDAGYLTSHQDISGKEDKSNKVTSLSVQNTDTQYPSAKAVFDNLSTKQDTINDLGSIRSGASEGTNAYQVTGDKGYNASAFSGLGRKNLTKNVVGGKNVLTQAMMSSANTIYVIQYDFTLGEDITVPANCVLEFDGGSLNGNGTGKDTITGNNTEIRAGLYQIFGDDLNLMYIYENGKPVWSFTNQANDLVGDLEDSVLVKYASTATSAGWLTNMSDGTTKIENNSTHNVSELFGIYRKVFASSFKVKEIYIDWFGLSGEGVQKAVDFAYSTKTYEVKISHNTDFVVSRPIMMRTSVRISGSGNPGYQSEARLRTNGLCCFGVFQSANSRCAIENLHIYGENASSTQYAVICYGSHSVKINDCEFYGYYRKGAIMYGSVLYPTITNCSFSMTYTNAALADPDAQCPFCVSALESTWDIAYYGINVGLFKNCSFNSRNPILFGGGILTIDHCDFEGGGIGKNGSVIDIVSSPSSTQLYMTDNYFEVSGIDDENIDFYSIIRIGFNGPAITFVNNQVYVSNMYGKKSFVIDFNGKYSGAIVFNGNHLGYLTDLFNRYKVQSNAASEVFNNGGDVINESYYNRIYDAGVDISENYIGNVAGNYLGDRYAYKALQGCGVLLPAGEKHNGNGILSFGSGNFINLRGTSAKLVKDSYFIREGVFFVRNGVLLIDKTVKNWNVTPRIVSGGLYRNFTPTIVTVKSGNTAFTRMGECVPVVRNGSIESVFTFGIYSGKAPANPSIEVSGSGSGAELELAYDASGNVTGINVVNGGSGYDDCYFVGSSNAMLYPVFTKITKSGVVYYRVSSVYAGFKTTGSLYAAGQKTLNLDQDNNKLVKASNIQVDAPSRTLLRQGGVPTDNYAITLGTNDIAVIYIINGDPYLVNIMRDYAKFGTTRPTVNPEDIGYCYFDNALSPARPIYWNGTAWVDATGVIAGTSTSGTFANKPTVSANSISIGFKYFCTDKQTTEGATDGIEIIHKGSDVWVDALGRVVS